MSIEKNQTCIICGKHFNSSEGLFLRDLNDGLKQQIFSEVSFAKNSSFICLKDLQHVRLANMQSIIDQDLEADQRMNAELQKELSKDNYVIRNLNDTVNGQLTRGQKMADAVAKFGGSWGFIITFTVVLVVWMTINVVHLFGIHFDPYPFILLNLFLSCVAAIQAPIIMMSQNRQADRDRFDAENDYRTNTKSEMEIRILHKKIDQMNEVQWPHILDIEKMQIEVMSEIENEIQTLRLEQEKNQARSRNTRHPSRNIRDRFK
ncbi:DUF1003 domain-containing protein [Companilactobacillus sp.]|jgi:uncharacterized membrane protein|uniref:DUF1003 domain-containing protein n=1 Tax=Companilactobacillus sp. TaxID=2767905 RepID=UPI0025BAF2C8|nr:DUF1003 domain-containing protein [Companilactobacillus sp.]MCH4009383.1 DUF1003 domain-containing protein [Companilactobacillus sp.]MCH4050438.1 DUF1003 domain-containing protein [Companilactobacillus sp.]MCH4077325.1 DUF1003 domain-containing protein [Companilactobacillus sp.]MCH4125901.1 DUF1003 domain-containing protein [Companilactobacillus sp.]MCI1311610.1 DUF1003 domain-containing protein [Companilactobacillus sp.]